MDRGYYFASGWTDSVYENTTMGREGVPSLAPKYLSLIWSGWSNKNRQTVNYVGRRESFQIYALLERPVDIS